MSDGGDTVAEQVAGLRRSYRPVFLARLAVLRTVERHLAAGTLSEEQRDEARRSAHNLAGSLGTFGIEGGSELARRLEWLLDEGPDVPDPDAYRRTLDELGRLLDEPGPNAAP